MSTFPRLLAALALALAVPAAAGAVSMTMEATKSDGGDIRLCVGLNSAGEKVAGTQNDLIWDGTCAALKKDSCKAIPDSKKPLHGNTPPTLQNTYRALVFALDNVEPIRDGALYCCDFELTAKSDCCAVKFDRVLGSDPSGNALSTATEPAQLCLNTGATAPAGAAAPAAPAAAPVASGGPPWLWIGLIAAAVIVAALLVTRKR